MINVVNLTVENAIQTLQESDIEVEILPKQYKIDTVIIKQSISPDEFIAIGSKVKLYTNYYQQCSNNDKVDNNNENNTLDKNFESQLDLNNEISKTLEETESAEKNETKTKPSQSDKNSTTSNDGNQLNNSSLEKQEEKTKPSQSDKNSITSNNNELNNSSSENNFDAPELPLIQGKFLYLKEEGDESPSFLYLDSESNTNQTSEPNLSQFKVLKVRLFSDNDIIEGTDFNISFESGSGFDVKQPFFNGIPLEISEGTYEVCFTGEYFTDGPYSEDEYGNRSYLRKRYKVKVNFDHDGDYILNIS